MAENRPNILIVMVDQLAGTFFPDGPEPWLHMPHLRALAERSTRFARAYTASPLCAPARASFMTGHLPRETGVYDNAAELRADLPTYAHHLRRAGYHTVLAGKMHFVGPDQLHGFESRLTTDIYPSDYGWTPDYSRPGDRIDWWYHNMGSVTGAGVAEITNQMEYDDAVAFEAEQKLYDLARGHDARPWCLTVSFTHPHDPYVARQRYWDLYADCAHLAPEVPPLPYADHDPHSQRILDANDRGRFEIDPEHVARARQAYFANVSYLDEKIGSLMRVLQETRQEAAIVFLSDHGDMLGERGLWFKMSFYEASSRVPLMIAAPGWEAGRVDIPVSTLDVVPTLAGLAGIAADHVLPWCDGVDLARVAAGHARGPVPMEYAAEASVAPLIGLVDGRWKYTNCARDPEQLFDLETDPHELSNLAEDPAHSGTLERFRRLAAERWDLEAFDAEVRESQTRRRLVYTALREGDYTPWDYAPPARADNRYMRNHMDLNVVEENQRFPRGE